MIKGNVWQWKVNNSMGEVSPDLVGRIDTPIYEKGAKRVENCLPMIEGPLQNFPEPTLKNSLDITATGAEHRIFRYNFSKHNPTPGYLLFVFHKLKLDIVRPDTFVSIKSFATSYTDAEVKGKLSIAQVEDSVMICCEGREPSLIRINENTVISSPATSFSEVDYWANIEYPPVEPSSTEYGTEGLAQIDLEEYNLFNWWKNKSTYYFEAAYTGAMLDTDYFNSLAKGQITLYGGKFYINKVEVISSKQRFTCSLLDEPEVTVPDGSANKELVDVRAFVFSTDILEGGTNYPANVTHYHDRLIFGNINKNASVIVSSRVGDISNFRTGTNDSDGFVTFIPGEQLERIRDITSYKSLLVFTDNGIWSTEMNTTLTPATSQVFPQEVDIPSEDTSSYCRSHGLLFYKDKFNKRINALTYIGDENVYIGQEVTTFSKHLFQDIEGISSLSWNNEEYLVSVQTDKINIMTFRKEENIMGWARLPRWDTGSISFLTEKKKTLMYILNDSGVLEEWDFLGATREKLVLELLPPTMDERIYLDTPPFMKRCCTIGRVKVAMYGDYDIKVNGKRKEIHFSKVGSEELHMVEWDSIEAGFNNPIRIEQLNDKPLKIVGISFEIVQEVE